MEIELLTKTARSATLKLADGGIYHTKEPYQLLLNGENVKETDTVVTSFYSLKPDTEYILKVITGQGAEAGSFSFRTDYEFVTLNVKDFGAKGDGESDDTKYIQAAILACPKDSRVLIPAGTYRITSLFLKSHVRIELAKDAELLAITERYAYPKFPALIESYDETDEYYLGTWEGNPLPMFAAIITGIDVEDVVLYGEGCVNGNASVENWWDNPKVMRGAFRPRTFFINHCEKIVLQGIKLCNSPAWTIHPFFSNKLGFYDLKIQNPSISPNTDGLDPESCKDVEIAGVQFSLGDDCIAVKSGKIYMGKKHKTPSENIHIYQCLMQDGHGAVTIGSEMAGGVKNLTVEECLFVNTDRGLRVKTRRGRGEDAVLDKITFRKINMDHVMTPFVVNCFYFCDPDGKTEYVQSREWMPVDQRTPYIKRLCFEDIDAQNCHVAAAYFDGLPEQKIEEIKMKNIRVSYAENPKCDVPSMSNGVEPCSLKGIYANNVKKLTLENVEVTGAVGEPIIAVGVDDLEQE